MKLGELLHTFSRSMKDNHIVICDADTLMTVTVKIEDLINTNDPSLLERNVLPNGYYHSNEQNECYDEVYITQSDVNGFPKVKDYLKTLDFQVNDEICFIDIYGETLYGHGFIVDEGRKTVIDLATSSIVDFLVLSPPERFQENEETNGIWNFVILH